MRLLRANPRVLREKEQTIRQGRIKEVLITLAHNQKERILKKSLKVTLKDQFLSILRQ
jgi:hypothetical protein